MGTRNDGSLRKMARPVLTGGLGALLLTSLLEALGLTGTPQEISAIGWVCTLVNLGVILWFVIELGILKGTPGPNRFGGDPERTRGNALSISH